MTHHSTMADSPSPKHASMQLDSLQILRALAALAVVVYHLGDSLIKDFGLTDTNPFAIGAYGVDLFFVISGFVICYASINTHSPLAFMKKRIFRIVPLYYLLTIGVFLVALAMPTLLNSTVADLSHLLKSLAFIPFEKAEGEVYPLLFLGWTLNFEMFFYLLFALCFGFKKYREIAAALLVIICVIIGSFIDFSQVVPEFFSRSIMLNFVWGIAVFLIYRHRPEVMAHVRWLWIPATLTILIQALAPLPFPREFSIGLPSAIILLSALPTQNISGRAGDAMKLIGDASYSLYLVHPYVRRQLSWPVDDNYLDRLSEALDTGGLALRCNSLVRQKNHSISGKKIHEQSSSRRFTGDLSGQGRY